MGPVPFPLSRGRFELGTQFWVYLSPVSSPVYSIKFPSFRNRVTEGFQSPSAPPTRRFAYSTLAGSLVRSVALRSPLGRSLVSLARSPLSRPRSVRGIPKIYPTVRRKATIGVAHNIYSHHARAFRAREARGKGRGLKGLGWVTRGAGACLPPRTGALHQRCRSKRVQRTSCS